MLKIKKEFQSLDQKQDFLKKGSKVEWLIVHHVGIVIQDRLQVYVGKEAQTVLNIFLLLCQCIYLLNIQST